MLNKRRRILLADDDEITRSVLASMLQLVNYEVDEVRDGCEVIKVFAVNSYDVILMDLKMRPMDGVTASLFVRLKEQELKRRTPIIALTACSPKDCREECLAAGINAYMAKPVDLKELLLLIEALLLEQDVAPPESQEPESSDTMSGPPSQRGTNEEKIDFVPSIAIPSKPPPSAVPADEDAPPAIRWRPMVVRSGAPVTPHADDHAAPSRDAVGVAGAATAVTTRWK